MPKSKSKKNKGSSSAGGQPKRDLEYKEHMEEYAKVTSLLGDRRLAVVLPDSSESMAIIPGKFRKKPWMRIGVGDVILVSVREFQEGKLDVLHKYTDKEVVELVRFEEIPLFFKDKEALAQDAHVDIGFDIVEDEEDEIDFDEI